MQAFLSQWQHWLPPLLVGAILTHLWARFRARMTVIRYQIHHLYLAIAQNSPIFGNLRVLLNEVEYHSLYLSSITFANDTARDFKDLDINIAAMPRTEILGGTGRPLPALTTSPSPMPSTGTSMRPKRATKQLSISCAHGGTTEYRS